MAAAAMADKPRHPSCCALRHNKSHTKFAKKSQFYAEVRKFLAGPIIETPLIVLQYYKKPSFLYIYIYKEEGPSYKERSICKFILQI